MASVFPEAPIFQLKTLDKTGQKHHGAVYLIHPSPLGFLPSSHYTRIDQALLIWAVAVGLIFSTAQFSGLDWHLQSILWSVLSVIAVGVSHQLTWPSVQYRHLRWVMVLWPVLMLLGIGITDYGVFTSQGWILGHMCDIWLCICALGYAISSVGMRSRPLAIIGVLHLLTIPVLTLVPQWSFLGTGIVMSWSLWLLAEVWWEHR